MHEKKSLISPLKFKDPIHTQADLSDTLGSTTFSLG